MPNKNYMIISATVLFCALLLVGYYFYPRNIKFELIQKSCINEEEHPLIILSEKEAFERFLRKNLDSVSYDNLTIEISLLDFNRYDYAITFNKQLLELKHSPYLSKRNDLCSYLKEKPVIPKYEENSSKQIYIYRLNRKSKYRSVCP